LTRRRAAPTRAISHLDAAGTDAIPDDHAEPCDARAS
jgi:hypothetical protein